MHAFVGHAAGEERRRQARFRRNAKWVLLLIALQTGVGLFGAYELEKGAAFHRFNHLHVSYAMIFQQQLEALVPPVSSSQRHDLERWVTRIRDQPVACLETAAWYDRIFIRLMGTGRALDLCRVDIEVADEALASLAAARGAQTDDAELLAQLERAAQRFHAHSEEFGPLIRDTVQVMYRTVLLVELLNGGVMLLLGWSLLRGLRRAFDQQEDLRRAADSANATKSRFLANMSHEIRTPLNGILGNLELASGLVRNPEVAEHLSIADRSAQSLLSIIDDVLDIAKIEADKLTLEAIPFDVGTLTKDVERLYRARAQAGALTLEVKGGLETPYRVGDPTRVRQVLSNLVSNALKFTPAGGRIFIEVREDGDRLDLIVADTGAGIPPEKQAAVFRSFEQADTSTTRQFGGSGLGLAIVDRLAQLMGGEVRLESEVGKGSRFTVTLPLPPSASPVSRPDLPSEAKTGDEVPPLRILLVDDVPTNVALARKMLERLGHTVMTASDGREAIEVYEASPTVDLIFMDIHMPVLDGIQATTELRARHGPALPPVVALTAHAMAQDRDRYLAEGMDDYLTKPVRSRDLHAAIVRCRAAASTPSEGA